MTTKSQAIIILTLVVPWLAVQAQTTKTAAATSPPAAAPSSTEQTINDIKNPLSWLTWGADLRIRDEYWNNAQTLTSDPKVNPKFATLHSQDVIRTRGRLWTSITPVENLSLNARLAAEPREWMEPSSFGTYFGRSGLEWRFGIVDNLNVQWKKPMDLPATLTVGRQDFMPGRDAFVGDGWLIGDGTPGDGSWTYFFDAARLNYELKDMDTTIDAVGLLQYAQPDAWLPTIGPSTMAGSPNRYTLTDQNETGAILSIANRSIPVANLTGYFIYKHDRRENNYPPGATSSANGTGTYANGDNADIYTFGGRASGLLKDHWKYSLEGAYQFGEKQDPNLKYSAAGAAAAKAFHDLNAFGVNSKLSYLFKDKLNNQVSLSYEYLSGDDPNSGNDEMFDVLWGRWPRWSELYNIYSYIPETRIGQTANVHRFGPGWTFNPGKGMDFILNYNLLYGDQGIPTRANVPTAFAHGNFRGHYVQAVFKYKVSQHFNFHLWSEFVLPGGYYVSRQTMTFLRPEVMFTF